MLVFPDNRLGGIVRSFLISAACVSSISGLLWRDVSQFYPEQSRRTRANLWHKTPVGSAMRANCTIDRLSQTDVRITGYNCKSIPSIDNPRNVSTVYIRRTLIVNISRGAFAGIPITFLHLTQSQVARIGADSLVDLELIETLIMDDNPLRFIHPNAFKPTSNLRFVSFERTQISQLSAIVPALSQLPRLEFLDLSFTSISSITSKDLSPLRNSTLKLLSLGACALLTTINPNAFRSLGNLEGLSLRDNMNLISNADSFRMLSDVIGNLTQPTFKVLDLTHLTALGVSRQLYAQVAKTNVEIFVVSTAKLDMSNDLFPVMDKITTLVDPMIKSTIKKGGLDSFPNLHEVVFGPLFSVEFSEGLALPRLEHIEITGFDRKQQVLTIMPGVFKTMSHLKRLILRHRAITDLRDATFVGLTSLTELSLAFCHLPYLPKRLFEPLEKLEKLDLTGNIVFALASAPERVFAPLRRLKYLSLSDTGANWFADGTFSQLISLEELRLDKNNLSIIPDLKPNVNLCLLDLSANRFKFFEEIRLKNGSYRNRLPDSLESLDLSHNEISYNLRIPDSVRYLNLSNNPYQCECAIRPLLSILSESRIELFNREFKTAYECARPYKLRGVHILSVSESLEKFCQPFVMVAVSFLSVGIVIVVILIIGAIVYKHRFQNWLENYANEGGRRFTCSTGGGGGGTRRKFAFDAFVSYSTHDVHFVLNDLMPRLESLKKLKLCVYDRDFLAGKSITDCVLESMKQSRKIIIVLSNHFLTSPWCKFETDLAQYTMLEENRDALIILKIAALDETKLNSRLSYMLKTRVHLDYCTMARDLFFDKLIDAVREDRPSYQRFRRNLLLFLGFRKTSGKDKTAQATAMHEMCPVAIERLPDTEANDTQILWDKNVGSTPDVRSRGDLNIVRKVSMALRKTMRNRSVDAEETALDCVRG